MKRKFTDSPRPVFVRTPYASAMLPLGAPTVQAGTCELFASGSGISW